MKEPREYDIGSTYIKSNYTLHDTPRPTPEVELWLHSLSESIGDLFLPNTNRMVPYRYKAKKPRPNTPKKHVDRNTYKGQCAWLWFDMTSDRNEPATFRWVCDAVGMRADHVLSIIQEIFDSTYLMQYRGNKEESRLLAHKIHCVLRKYNIITEYAMARGYLREPKKKKHPWIERHGAKGASARLRLKLMGWEV